MQLDSSSSTGRRRDGVRMQRLLLLLLALLLVHAATIVDAFHLPCASSTPRPPLRMSSTTAATTADPTAPDPSEGFKRLLHLPNPPGPRRLPVVGNMLQLLAFGANFDRYDAWVKRKHGNIALSHLLGTCFMDVYVYVVDRRDIA